MIKGCWQLSGGHRGDPQSDRTTGSQALEDFAAFYDAGGGAGFGIPRHTRDILPSAGITSWDCADHYGPAEALIGRYSSPVYDMCV